MSLRDELGEPQRRASCLTCDFIESQPADDQAEWHELMGDKNVPSAGLYRLARRRGFPGGMTAMGNHRTNHAQDPE